MRMYSLLLCMEHTIILHLQPCAPQGIHEMDEGAEEGEEEEERVDDEEVAPDELKDPNVGVYASQVGVENAEETKRDERQKDDEKHEGQDGHVTAAAPVDPIAAPAIPTSLPLSTGKNASI